MSSEEEKIGYLTGKVEAIAEKIDRHIEEETKERIVQTLELKKDFEKLHICISGMQKQLSMYRHFIMFFKMTLGIAAAVLAFKFGDVASVWERFWHAS